MIVQLHRLIDLRHYSGPWNVAASGELEDSRQQEDPLPLQTFTFNPISARFVKFEITSFYGTGGGLQYFNVVVYKNVKTRRIEICSSDIGEHVFCRNLHIIKYCLNVLVTVDPALYRELDSLPIPNVKLDEFPTTSMVNVCT